MTLRTLSTSARSVKQLTAFEKILSQIARLVSSYYAKSWRRRRILNNSALLKWHDTRQLATNYAKADKCEPDDGNFVAEQCFLLTSGINEVAPSQNYSAKRHIGKFATKKRVVSGCGSADAAPSQDCRIFDFCKIGRYDLCPKKRLCFTAPIDGNLLHRRSEKSC